MCGVPFDVTEHQLRSGAVRQFGSKPLSQVLHGIGLVAGQLGLLHQRRQCEEAVHVLSIPTTTHDDGHQNPCAIVSVPRHTPHIHISIYSAQHITHFPTAAAVVAAAETRTEA